MFQTTDPLTSSSDRAREACAYDEASDVDLVAWVARYDDRAAFDAIYRRHAPAVLKVARQVCRNDAVADEVAQQAFVSLWERASRLASKSLRVRPWLTTVARNAAIDVLRSGAASTLPLDEAFAQPHAGPGPDELAVIGESVAQLRRALATLVPAQRDAVEMVYFNGMTYQAAANALGIPLGTIKSRVRLALEHLRAGMIAR